MAFEDFSRSEIFNQIESELIFCMDLRCREKLIEGNTQLFCELPHLEKSFLDYCNTTYLLDNETLNDKGRELFLKTLEFLESKGDIIFATDRHRVRSRFFETIYYLINLKQITHSKNRKISYYPSLTERIKVEIKRRQRPRRKSDTEKIIKQYFEDLISDLLFDSDYIDFDYDFDFETFLLELCNNVLLPFIKKFFPSGLSQFQIDSIKELLDSSLKDNNERDFVITAGTGFGKTEAFLIPVLIRATIDRWLRSNKENTNTIKFSPSSILLYPRVDLCNNQLERIVKYLLFWNKSLDNCKSYPKNNPINVSISHSRLDSLKIECPECREELGNDESNKYFIEGKKNDQNSYAVTLSCQRRPFDHKTAINYVIPQTIRGNESADIAIMTIDTLHRRLFDKHGNSTLFIKNFIPRFIVIDEMHIYEGQSGIHTAFILRRLRQRLRLLGQTSKRTEFVGVSATISEPELVAKTLFGGENISIIRPNDNDTNKQGLEYFIFLLSPGNRFLLDNVLMNRTNVFYRENNPVLEDDNSIDEDEVIIESNECSNDLVKEQFVSERATMIQAAFALHHTMKLGNTCGSKRRSLGFIDSVDGCNRFGLELHDAEWQNISPKTTKRIIENKKMPLFALRLPVAKVKTNVAYCEKKLCNQIFDTKIENITYMANYINNICPRKQKSCNCEQPPHYLLESCPRYESGDCWFTMSEEANLYPLLTQIHSASGRAWADGSNINESDWDNWRMLVSTSSLEVGFDHPEIIATWQYHAPMNLSSYVQRKGRGGRGVNDYPITMMVLGTSEPDTHAFVDHMRYVEIDNFECFLNSSNPTILKQHIFSAMLDYFASKGYSDNINKLRERFSENLNSGLRSYLIDCFYPLQGSDEGLNEIFVLLNKLNKPLPISNCNTEKKILSKLNKVSISPLMLFNRDFIEDLKEWFKELEDEKYNYLKLWLNGAIRFLNENSQKLDLSSMQLIDLFKYIPHMVYGDLKIPSNTLPVPLGGFINVYIKKDGGETIVSESADFALRSFLPGGFKMRYKELVSALWKQSSCETYGNLTWADLSEQLFVDDSDILPKDVEGLFTKIPVNMALCQQYKDSFLLDSTVYNNASLVYINGLKVISLGKPQKRSFLLNKHSLHIQIRLEVGDNKDDFDILSRDPNLVPLFYIIPLKYDSNETRCFSYEWLTSVSFVEKFSAIYCYYGNLINCYLKEGEVKEVIIRFFDEKNKRPMIVGVNLKSEALSFCIDRQGWKNINLTFSQKRKAFWIKFEEIITRKIYSGHCFIDNIYWVKHLISCLQFIEIEEYDSTSFFMENNNNDIKINENVYKKLSKYAYPEKLFKLLCDEKFWLDINMVFKECNTWLERFGKDIIIGQTLLSTMRLAMAKLIGVSSECFLPKLVIDEQLDKINFLIIDKFENGAGNVRQCLKKLSSMDGKKIIDLIKQEKVCEAHNIDLLVNKVFSSNKKTDILHQLSYQKRILHTLGYEDLNNFGRAERYVSKLLETPNLAAFYAFVYKERIKLEKKYNCLPPIQIFDEHIRKTQALDARAENLRQLFINEINGSSQLTSRLEEIYPLCDGGCIECIACSGNDDLKYANRQILEDLVK